MNHLVMGANEFNFLLSIFFIIKHSYTVHLEGSRLLFRVNVGVQNGRQGGGALPVHHLTSTFGRSQVPPTLGEAVSPSRHTIRVGPEGEFISLSKDVAMMAAAFLTGQRTGITHRKYAVDEVTKKAPWHQLGGWVGSPKDASPCQVKQAGWSSCSFLSRPHR